MTITTKPQTAAFDEGYDRIFGEKRVAHLLCSKCGEIMKRIGEEILTELPFDSPYGYCSPIGHNHDEICRSRMYVCQCGNSIQLAAVNRCHACDWVSRDTCFCHPGKKLQFWPDDA